MCCDATVCSTPSEVVGMPDTRDMQCLITSITHDTSGNRNGLLV
jgi:hypothetical protein